MTINRIGQLARNAWLFVGSMLLILGVFEAAVAVVRVIHGRVTNVTLDDRARADTYRDTTLAREYFEEFQRSSATRWKPYTYWQRKPFQGRLINVDTNGVRRSVPLFSPPGATTPIRIYMFGGSTMWGTGTDDASTISSLVKKELLRSGVPAEVTNFGETGYVSTQEVIALTLQLQRGRVPDVVIFYDGVNDVFSAFQQQQAGLPQNEYNRVREFNLSQPDHRQARLTLVLRDLADQLTIVGILRSVVGRHTATQKPLETAAMTARDSVLIDQLLAVYQGNAQIVTALGEYYRFRSLFYWQPLIFQKATLSEYERKQRETMLAFEPFNRQTNERIRQMGLGAQPGSGFHDLSLILADVPEPLFVDWIHLGDAGNAIIARRISRDVLRELASRASLGRRRAGAAP